MTVITSWYFQNQGFDHFDMNHIRNRIFEMVRNSNVFIYMFHMNDYGIDANHIEKYVNSNCLVLKIPNLRLDFDKPSRDLYLSSLNILKYSIETSDFHDYQYIIDNHKNYIFFNTNEHPTHFLLYLLARSILNKICKIHHKESLQDYFNKDYRNHFLSLNRNYVILPGRQIITPEINQITGISCNAEYFDS